MYICVYDEVDSTNKIAKNFITSLNNSSVLCDNIGFLSYSQTQGVGKLSKQWFSVKDNLHFSLILQQGIYFYDLKNIGLISLLIGVSIKDTLSSYIAYNRIKLKWPNDVLVDEKKISGILIEIESDKLNRLYIIIGIGLNLIDFPKNLSYETTSLYEIIKKKVDPLQFAQLLKDNIVDNLIKMKSHLLNIKNIWMQSAYGLHNEITIKSQNIIKKGIFKGLTQEGFLILNINNKDEIITTLDIFNITGT